MRRDDCRRHRHLQNGARPGPRGSWEIHLNERSGSRKAVDAVTSPEPLEGFRQLFAEHIQSRSEFRGETTFLIEAADLREVATRCREELSFDYLLDISSVDN